MFIEHVTMQVLNEDNKRHRVSFMQIRCSLHRAKEIPRIALRAFMNISIVSIVPLHANPKIIVTKFITRMSIRAHALPHRMIKTDSVNTFLQHDYIKHGCCDNCKIYQMMRNSFGPKGKKRKKNQ